MINGLFRVLSAWVTLLEGLIRTGVPFSCLSLLHALVGSIQGFPSGPLRWDKAQLSSYFYPGHFSRLEEYPSL